MSTQWLIEAFNHPSIHPFSYLSSSIQNQAAKQTLAQTVRPQPTRYQPLNYSFRTVRLHCCAQRSAVTDKSYSRMPAASFVWAHEIRPLPEQNRLCERWHLMPNFQVVQTLQIHSPSDTHTHMQRPTANKRQSQHIPIYTFLWTLILVKAITVPHSKRNSQIAERQGTHTRANIHGQSRRWTGQTNKQIEM